MSFDLVIDHQRRRVLLVPRGCTVDESCCLADELAAIGRRAAQSCRLAVSTPGPARSRPGESPRLQTGAGRDSIEGGFDGELGAAFVGLRPGGVHLWYLEFGTRHVSSRPWLISTLSREMPVLEQMWHRALA